MSHHPATLAWNWIGWTKQSKSGSSTRNGIYKLPKKSWRSLIHMIDFIVYALEVLGWAVVLMATSAAFVLIFWPDKDKS